MTADLLNFIAGWEGRKVNSSGVHVVYRDSMRTGDHPEGILTVAYGLNLERPDAKQRLHSVGLMIDISPSNLPVGLDLLTEDQARELLRFDAEACEHAAFVHFPFLDTYPEIVSWIITDMIYNLGPHRFAGFKKFAAAVKSRDWQRAAEELKNSRWFHQTGRRALHHYNAMLNLAAAGVP